MKSILNLDTGEYISSGIIESYVLGLLSDEERAELLVQAALQQEVAGAILEAEQKIEKLSLKNAVPPPKGLWGRIQLELV